MGDWATLDDDAKGDFMVEDPLKHLLVAGFKDLVSYIHAKKGGEPSAGQSEPPAGQSEPPAFVKSEPPAGTPATPSGQSEPPAVVKSEPPAGHSEPEVGRTINISLRVLKESWS